MKRQWREAGETEWKDCDEDWFNYCRESRYTTPDQYQKTNK